MIRKKIFTLIFAFLLVFSRGFIFAGDDLDGNDDGDTDYGAGWQGGDDDDSGSSSGGNDSGGGSSNDDSNDDSGNDSNDDSGGDDSGSNDDGGDNGGSDSGGDDGGNDSGGDDGGDDSSGSDDSSSGSDSGGGDESLPDGWVVESYYEIDLDTFDGYGFRVGDEVFATVFGAEGYVYFITVDDVYDKNGNFIFVYQGPGDPDVVNARLEEIFSGKKDYESIDAFTALSSYLTARLELDAAIKSGKEAEELDALKEKVSDAREALEYCCWKEGYTWTLSENGNFGTITNSEGKTVYHVGDPVVFASGEFIIDDADISLSYRRSFFSLKRHYSSGVKSSETRKNGIFGYGWSSNLETRIVAGYSQDFINALPQWEQYMAKLEESEKNIAAYVDEDAGCTPLYEEILSLKESAARQYEIIREYAEKSAEVRANDIHVLYGRAGELAPTLGLDTVIYCQDDGSMLVFGKNDDGSFSLKDGLKNCAVELTAEPDGYCLSYTATGEKRYYSKFGLPVRFTYRNGGSVNFVYDDTGKIGNVVVDGIRALSFTWSGERLLSVKDDVGGRQIAYTYDDDRLSSVTDWDGDTKRFEYDSEGIISRQIKSDGSFVFFEFSEIGGTRRTVRTVNEEGDSETFEYDLDNLSTLYKNQDGVSTLFTYDERGRTLREEHADGYFTDYEYDEDNRLLSKTDNFGKITLSYDELGNIVQKEYPDGTSERWTYCDAGIASFTDRDGISQTYYYGQEKLLTDIYRGSSILVHFEYGDDGLLENSYDCFGNRTSFSYDLYGNIVEKSLYAPDKNTASKTEKWTYDTYGRVTSHTDALNQKTEYKYGNHKIEINCPASLKIEEEYSSRKLLLSKTFTDTRTGEKRCFSYDYDKNKRVKACYISGTDIFGIRHSKTKLFENAYSAGGKVKKIIEYAAMTDSGKSVSTEYSYGSDGSVSHVSRGFYDGTSGGFLSEPVEFTHSASYTSEGRLCTKLNSEGSVEIQLFDSAGRLLHEGENESLKIVNEYSGAGRLVRSKKGKGGFYEYEYDSTSGFKLGVTEESGISSFGRPEYYANGSLKSTVSARGIKTEYFYDEFKNLVKIEYPYGAVERSFDAIGRLTSEKLTDKNGNIIKEDSYKYSDLKIEHYSGGKYGLATLLNAFGEEIAVVDAYGNKKIIERDLLGRIVSESDFYGVKKYFSYGDGGNISKVLFVDGTFLKFSYDAFSNCTEARDSAGILWKKTYDSRGRLSTFSERPFFVTESYEYDDFGDIVCVRRNGLLVQDSRFSPDGKTFERTDALGNKNVCDYDGFGRILSRRNSLGYSSKMDYASDGIITTFTDFNGGTRNYNYSNNLLSVNMTCYDGSFVSYDYDIAGNLIRAKNNASDFKFSYNTACLLVSQTESVSGTEISYDYDLRKNISEVKSEKRRTSYTWGKNAELLSVSERIVQGNEVFLSGVKFVYDKMGREVLRVYGSGESVKSSYDSAGRLVLMLGYDSFLNLVFIDGSVYDENGAKKYSLDSNLNVTAYSYDEFGRLSLVSYPYSESLARKMKKQCRDAGLYFLEGHEKTSRHSISEKDYLKIQSLCSQIALGFLQAHVTAPVLSESFTYDANNNMLSRTNPYGTVNYTYDSENRLVSWGEKCVAKYDKNGNMILHSTALSEIAYEYTAFDRIKALSVLDYSENERFNQKYAYDALGRRCLFWSDEEGTGLNSYVGFTTRIFESKRFLSDECFNAMYSKNSNSNSVFKAPVGRYVFIEDEADSEETVTETSTEEAPFMLSPSYDYRGRLLSVFSYGKQKENGFTVTMTGEEGTVLAELPHARLRKLYEYDAFGSPVENAPSFAFVGKTYDERSGLYDFGFRDYEPSLARFSSPDPVFDGVNWYSYCDGNPLLFFDRDGLSSVKTKEQYMQSMGHVLLGASDSEYADQSGCLVTAIAQALTAFTGIAIENSYVNSLSECFNGGEIDWPSVKDVFGLSISNFFEEENALSVLAKAVELFEAYDAKTTKTKEELEEESKKTGEVTLNDLCTKVLEAYQNYYSSIEHSVKIMNSLSEIEKSSVPVTVVARVCYDAKANTSSNTDGLHFVEIGTKIEYINGKGYVSVTATSKYDTATSLSSARKESGWIVKDNVVYVPLSMIQRIDTVSKAQ